MNRHMKVVIESPYAADTETELQKNIDYAKEALLDSLNRLESPFASHLLYTQVLNDKDPIQRQQGIQAGISYYEKVDLCAVYGDKGISKGMWKGIEKALKE